MKKVWIGKNDDLSLDHIAPAEKKHRYPLLFIHGMHEGAWIFENWLRVAADMGWNSCMGWDAWAINLRGHHGSRPVKDFGKVSIMHYVEDIEDVLREIGPAILVGHSMGGLIAQIVADRNMDIRAVVLLNSAPPHGISPASWATISRYWKPQYIVASMLKRPLPPQKVDMMSLVLNGLPWWMAESTFLSLVPESGLAAKELTFWRWRGQETKIYCPVLVIGATEDRLTPVRIQKAIAKKYPRAKYMEIPGAHMLPLESGREELLRWILLDLIDWAADHNL